MAIIIKLIDSEMAHNRNIFVQVLCLPYKHKAILTLASLDYILTISETPVLFMISQQSRLFLTNNLKKTFSLYKN